MFKQRLKPYLFTKHLNYYFCYLLLLNYQDKFWDSNACLQITFLQWMSYTCNCDVFVFHSHIAHEVKTQQPCILILKIKDESHTAFTNTYTSIYICGCYESIWNPAYNFSSFNCVTLRVYSCSLPSFPGTLTRIKLLLKMHVWMNTWIRYCILTTHPKDTIYCKGSFITK